MNKNRRKLVLMLSVVAVIGSAEVSRAATINQGWTFEGGDWGSTNFNLVGGASWANETTMHVPHRLRMTDNNTGQQGSSWLNTTTVNAAADWSIVMRGVFSEPTGSGADELSVGFQSSGLTQNGFFTASDYLQVALDSYKSGDDPYANTLYVRTSKGLVGTLDLSSALESNDYFSMWVSYNASTHALNVTFDSDPLAPVNGSWTVDLSGEFSSAAYYGFSGWTGAASENHDVLSTTINATVVPEPSTFSLLAAGVAVVLLRRKERA